MAATTIQSWGTHPLAHRQKPGFRRGLGADRPHAVNGFQIPGQDVTHLVSALEAIPARCRHRRGVLPRRPPGERRGLVLQPGAHVTGTPARRPASAPLPTRSSDARSRLDAHSCPLFGPPARRNPAVEPRNSGIFLIRRRLGFRVPPPGCEVPPGSALSAERGHAEYIPACRDLSPSGSSALCRDRGRRRAALMSPRHPRDERQASRRLRSFLRHLPGEPEAGPGKTIPRTTRPPAFLAIGGDALEVLAHALCLGSGCRPRTARRTPRCRPWRSPRGLGLGLGGL